MNEAQSYLSSLNGLAEKSSPGWMPCFSNLISGQVRPRSTSADEEPASSSLALLASSIAWKIPGPAQIEWVWSCLFLTKCINSLSEPHKVHLCGMLFQARRYIFLFFMYVWPSVWWSPLPEMVMVPVCIWIYTWLYKYVCIYVYIYKLYYVRMYIYMS